MSFFVGFGDMDFMYGVEVVGFCFDLFDDGCYVFEGEFIECVVGDVGCDCFFVGGDLVVGLFLEEWFCY